MGDKPNYQKIPVHQLVPGMWICRLDQDAPDSAFESQSFYFTSEAALLLLCPDCKYVYIDVNRSLQAPSERQDGTQEARKLYLNLRTQMDRVMGDIRLGNALQHKRMRNVLEDLMEAVLHDSKSMVYLAMLRNHQDELVSKAVSVAVLSLVFAKHIGLRQDQLLPLGMGALLHPVGLLQVPNEILTKTDPLTETEKELIRQYPRRGHDYLLAQGGFDDETLDVVLHHQERLNGEGYPDRLKGRDISFLARMVAITSVYEALTRDRSYRQALSPTKALSQLYRWRFHDFDSRLVEKFIQSLGVYPPGCLVELSNGALAVVHATHTEQRTQPQVLLLTCPELKPLEQQELVDLAQTPRLDIRKALDPSDPRLEKLLKSVMSGHPGFPI
ncbi:HD-GYP domain-containing protein [Marinospirillum alkaliphilum]|uniref:HD-GYP domain, c-di-GMP phosphodiesterase class II (Or its inactivated variant) n=1 Tax=Marinospirillum alkaliphilum DSM 21637 TaxID=1122209 RepID=A0A1K1XIL6_9GAMM|nr:HD-GYP domain-containing protein [Marinospirillum alkaliphilum]SFX49529.1 HD-GYP domain, c-di-GMP phosphodiesterase class II (or its inactivated variant) [Marinospirillum alkaliphilum DSM 21637]